jgi:DNA-binding MarR family transcriptional regulator
MDSDTGNGSWKACHERPAFYIVTRYFVTPSPDSSSPPATVPPSSRNGARSAKTAARLSRRDYQLLAEFRYLVRRFVAFSEAAARQAGLTPRHHQALLAIKGNHGKGPMSVGALAERLALRHHSVVGLLDRLASRGLIRRQVSPADRRQVLIELTPRAEALLEELSLVHRGELKRLAPLLQPLLEQLQDG